MRSRCKICHSFSVAPPRPRDYGVVHCVSQNDTLPDSGRSLAVKARLLDAWVTEVGVLVQAEVGGTVTKLIVDNGTPVTPGQSLLVIKP